MSGGANRGAMQAGAIRTLGEEGLTFDLLVGTSAGALNAVYLATGATRSGHDNSSRGGAR